MATKRGAPGKPKSAAHRRNISNALKGKPRPAATRAKISKNHARPMLNRKHTQEARAKMKANHKGMSGKRHSPEARARMRAAHAARKKAA